MSKTKARTAPGLDIETSPQQRTAELLDISVTERGQFKQCRRRWELSTIKNLEPKAPTWALKFGSGIHLALEAMYLVGAGVRQDDRSPLDVALDVFDIWHTDIEFELKEIGAGEHELQELWELRSLGHEMIENYVAFDRASKAKLGEILMVEGELTPAGEDILGTALGHPDYPDASQPIIDRKAGRILVPIVDPVSLEPISDRVPCLTMKLDVIAQRKTPRKGLWVVDHKTSSSAYNDRGLDFDDQPTGYCYGLYRLTGIVPRGAVFNVLIKERIKEPRVGQRGLSYAKDQLTTPDLYREALKEHGLMSGKRITSEKHAECLNALLGRGWRPWFQRLEPTRNEYELKSFEGRLFQEYWDMHEALDANVLYPNQTTRTCPYCPVNTICQAMEDGSDVEGVMSGFTVAEDRKAA